MEHEKIQFPESYTNALNPEEVEELATALGVKFDLNDKYYDGAFGKIQRVVCRFVRDNIDKTHITEDMKWSRVENGASWTDNEGFFRDSLSKLSGDRKAEALCSLALAKKGTLKREIAEKVGKMIRDLINENNARYSEAA
ncbi:hypothetical protein HON22_01380 [Candidatus Peregrinibacteria bacterium]|jgi:hypothetical protein|nr:hypothetical protein [Candidatus Peregrinibacteria bacterium]